MKRWRSPAEHADDPGRCPVCHNPTTRSEFGYDGPASWTDDSCARCGATWQTTWRATGYVGLHVPTFENPSLRDLPMVWREALRELFPAAYGDANMVGRLRSMALAKAWLHVDAEGPAVLDSSYEGSWGFQLDSVTHGDLYSEVSTSVVRRLMEAVGNGALPRPSATDIDEVIRSRSYQISHVDDGWVVGDEDGIRISDKYASEDQARLAVWLHASVIIPTRPIWGPQTERRAPVAPHAEERRLYDAGADRADALRKGRWVATRLKVQVLVAGEEVYVLPPTCESERAGYARAMEEIDDLQDRSGEEREALEYAARHGPDTDAEDHYTAWLIEKEEAAARERDLFETYRYFKGGE